MKTNSTQKSHNSDVKVRRCTLILDFVLHVEHT